MAFSSHNHPRIVGYVPADKAARIGAVSPIPIVDMPLADQRKWCVAAADWLSDGTRPSSGCPTADLRADGTCQRSPSNGPCLLLLPGKDPDWQEARQWRFDQEQNAFVQRPKQARAHRRQPISLEELSPPASQDRILDEWQRREQRITSELAELRNQGFPVMVSATDVLNAEMAGKIIDLETGEVE